MPALFNATAGCRSWRGTSWGTIDCQAGAIKEAEGEKVERRDQVKPDHQSKSRRQKGNDDLHPDQQLAAIEDVGQRTRRQAEQKHRQRCRDLNQGDDQRVRIELGH
jgi:hypothetical protein